MAKKKIVKRQEQTDESRMPLSRKNYILMLAGLGIIILGFVLMAGGGSDDPAVFNYDMFSWRRTTLAPIVVVAGFAFEVYAIMHRPKK
jgi:hypothetical protein